MGSTDKTAGERAPASDRHSAARDRFAAEHERLSRVENRYSLLRLAVFVGAAIAFGVGFYEQRPMWILTGSLGMVAFIVAVMRHLGVVQQRELVATRKRVHERHLERIARNFRALPQPGAAGDTGEHARERELPPGHAYAWDIDLAGPSSLLRLIDVTHTRKGHATLRAWLGQGADPETIRRRQAAVRELSEAFELRQELEAAALISTHKGEDLNGESFAELAELPSVFAQRPWLAPAIIALPLLTLAAYLLARTGTLPAGAWVLPLAAQFGLVMMHQKHTSRAFNLGSARQGVVEAFERLLITFEGAEVAAPLLKELQASLNVGDTPPSAMMSRLRKWVSLGELRQQALLWIVINPLVLWDLHVLRGLEGWNRDAGKRTRVWFEVLGQLEALCALATLAALDPDASFPEVGDAHAPLEAEGLAHPLLASYARVANDLHLRGPGTALMVTGSNMAGKSTLLRAVGLNVALGLAGGPVCARRMTVPQVRLRASMRAQDNLDEGASYFHAELQKLKGVVEGAEQSPPILFLLDELLRGTNERARHIGAKAVLLHLLERHGTGLVATHDVALANLEEADPRVDNVHFTDVVLDGEMTFDYRLRPGVVRTSNALRLLAMAGIDVPEDERKAMEQLEPPGGAAESRQK